MKRKWMERKIMKDFFYNRWAEIGAVVVIVISVIFSIQNDEYCTENIWVDDEKSNEGFTWIDGNYCVDVEDSLMYPFKAELEARFEDTVNTETTEIFGGLISNVDYQEGCYHLVYLYVHSQIVYENFNEDLEAQYHLDVRKFYKSITGVDENFDYFELERIGLEKDCFK